MKEYFYLLSVITLVSLIAFLTLPDEQPEILDSMLCEKHVPTGTMLVTDSYIKSKGKRYGAIE